MANFTSREQEFIKMLCSDTNGYFKIHCGHNRSGNFVPASALCSKKSGKYITGIKLDDQNKMITQSTYIRKGNACLSNINTVCCLAIDVDYEFKDKKGNLLDPLVVWNQLCWDCVTNEYEMPVPTYVEYGHRFRLVYIFNSPVCLRISDKEKRRKTVVWLNRIGQTIADGINAINPLYHASAQSLTKSLRIPGSINAKFEMDYDRLEKIWKPRCLYKYIVCIKKPVNSKRWDVHELSDYVLPTLPDWYGGYIKKKSKKAPLISLSNNVRDVKTMLKNRLRFLEKLQKLGWDRGYREMMCFLYWNFCLQSGMSGEDAKQKTCDFNRHFLHPLPEKEMLQHSRPRKLYLYRVDTILRLLGVPTDLAVQTGLINTQKKLYDRAYSRRYRMLKKMEKKKKASNARAQIVDMVHELRQMGKTIAEIAISVNRSVSTVKRILAPT